MSFAIALAKNRSTQHVVTLFEADGTTPVILASGDKVRFKMFRRDGSTPELDIDNVGALSGGSIIVVDDLDPATITLTVAQGDIDETELGTWRGEIDVVDVSDSNRIKHAESGFCFVTETGGGEIGLT